MKSTVLLLLAAFACQAVIVDRIAIVANNKPIKDSDIERDIRLTDFLNGDQLGLAPEDRKKAARRLIDQQIIRREIEVGNYPSANDGEVDNFLKTVKQQRFSGESAYSDSLQRYGVTEAELRDRLNWQIRVLHFIDQRFRPAVIVSDQDIDAYAKEHRQTREQAQEQLTGQKVNQAFESWLNGSEQRANVQYREEGLK